MTHVLFQVPSFINGGFPVDGPVSTDVSLIGTDGVSVLIFKNASTMFTKNTLTFDAISATDTILYQFVFPLGTLVNPDTTQYTTPNKSVYIFSDGTNASKSKGKLTKNVMTGTITIKPSPPSFVDSSTLNESSLAGGMSMDDMSKDKDHPFYSMGVVVYKLFMDMLSIFIFWMLFLSISCWLSVPSEYIYPTDVSQYPYAFYEENVKTYDIIRADGSDICTEIGLGHPHTNAMNVQKDFFKKIHQLEEKVLAFLTVIYPAMTKQGPTHTHQFSSWLLNKCKKEDKNNLDYFVYFVEKILLNNYLQNNALLGLIHMGCSILYKALSNLPEQVSIVAFAVLLYLVFLTVGSTNEKTMRVFHIHLSTKKDLKSILMNQFLQFIVSILSCFLSIALPLATLLVVSSLLTTLYTLFMTCFESVRGVIFFTALISLLASMSQVLIILVSLGTGTTPMDLLGKLFISGFSVSTLLSILGVILPIVFGLLHGMSISAQLFLTFFRFLKIPELKDLLKKSSASIVMVALLLLMIIVKEVLGDMFVLLTFMIIACIGYYVLTKTG